MAVITAANFRSIFTVIENRRPPGGPHRSAARTSPPIHPTGTGSQDHLRGNSVAAQINLSAGRAAYSIDTTI